MTIIYCIVSFIVGIFIAAYVLTSRYRGLISQQAADIQRKTEEATVAASRIADMEKENRQLLARGEADRREISMLREQMADEQRRQQEKFDNQLRTVEQRLQVLAGQVLERQAEKLQEGNTAQMQHVTAPLRESLEQMREALARNDKMTAESKASIAEQIRQLLESNRMTAEKTQRLTSALKGENKVQGNWGEVVLGDILESQGLHEGLHYETQARLRDERGNAQHHIETGAALQPDVILHYPQQQDVVIDAKVSLKAYMNFCEATDDATRLQCVEELTRSVREQVKRLSKKDYSSYLQPGRRTIDFVVMFVPNESALQLALAHDPRLWNEAFQQKVLIAGEQNLMAILHIIQIAWQHQQQAENQQRVFGIADELVKRIGMFVDRYEKLGKAVADLQKQYDSTADKLYAGNQSVLKKGRELVDLGAKQDTKYRLPETD